MKKKISRALGASMMEILIVVTLFSLLLLGILVLLNPLEQIAKARDAQRKNDLNELRKIMEDWYSNKACYPTKDELCYKSVSSKTCEICTSETDSPSLAKYTSSPVCDPEHGLRDYLYEIQGSDPNCPSSYIIYSKLTSTYQRENDIYNCGPFHGCGPIPSYGYDYLVSSSNAEFPVPSTNYYCIRRSTNDCGSCQTFLNCIDQVNQEGGSCLSLTKIYPSRLNCCNANPGACP